MNGRNGPNRHNIFFPHVEHLRQIIQRLARPIEFASRDAYAHLSAVKNLGPFVSQQVIRALSENIYLPRIEADLLALRQLFSDFDERLDPMEQKRRLATAKAILERLEAAETVGDARNSKAAENAFEVDARDVRRPTPESGANPFPTQLRTSNVDRRTFLARPRAVHVEPVHPARPAELWTVPIRFIRGVGPKRAALFEKLGIQTVEDALWHLPWRYEDRSVITPIGRLSPDTQATICGVVFKSTLKRTARRRMTVLDVMVHDTSGVAHGVFFNQPYLERVLKPGTRVMLSGRVSVGRTGWSELQMEGPQYEVLENGEETLHVGRLVPIYHETKGVTSRHLRVLIKGLLDQYVHGLEDVLPAVVREKYRLPSIQAALQDVHFPPASADRGLLDRGQTPAHRRLAFEEFFLLELALALRRRAVKEEVKGIRFDVNTPLIGRLRALLPFQLTPAQQRVWAEIQSDMASAHPMNRLIQGDVGCGKTVVALHAMVAACGSGYQAALMVPTEILAEQHYLNLRGFVEQLGLKAVLLKSGASTKARATVLKQIEDGEAHVVIGTHALIQKGVRFHKLGLAIIDEQHKFGVLQRKTLLEKGYHPDVLVMTATPIPRTLAMTVYGDLDISVIDALPPGRKPVRTWLFADAQRGRAYQVLQDEVRAGRQAYIVYPLVEESEKVDLQAAIQAAERLQAKEFKAFRIGLLHGRMRAEEKDRVMAAFKSREIHILVSTSVIEVGVDVPNATVMLVEHAERFGLAQLHQLRGRVGRGAQQSYCLLLMSQAGRKMETGPSVPSLARQRLEALVKSSDGFVIAEEDLRLRGPGEFFGLRQWGPPEFRAANLIRDGAMLEQARQEAFALLEADPYLEAPIHRALRAAMFQRWKAKLDLGSVS